MGNSCFPCSLTRKQPPHIFWQKVLHQFKGLKKCFALKGCFESILPACSFAATGLLYSGRGHIDVTNPMLLPKASLFFFPKQQSICCQLLHIPGCHGCHVESLSLMYGKYDPLCQRGHRSDNRKCKFLFIGTMQVKVSSKEQ